jgi:hypothetical protein
VVHSDRSNHAYLNPDIWLTVKSFDYLVYKTFTHKSNTLHVRPKPLSKTISQTPPPTMDNRICVGVLATSCVVFLSDSRRRSGVSFWRSFACDYLNTFTVQVLPHVVSTEHNPVDVWWDPTSHPFLYPCQRTLYNVVLTFSSPTWWWKSSQIPTICLGIHSIDPSVWCENTFQQNLNTT